MLKVRNIYKNFKGFRVLEDISFEYSGDGIIGIVGPNGSGKTTLLNIISGNIMPSSGDIFYEGKKINDRPLQMRAALGMVRTYQDGKVFPNHTLREHLLLLGNIERNKNLQDIDAVLDNVGLGEKADEPAATLSFGQKRRLELAMALSRTDAKLYLFDEPTNGVDPGFIEELKDKIKSLRIQRKGIIIVEHNLELIRDVADQIVVLEGGTILAMGNTVEILQRQDVHDAYLGGVYAS